MEVNMTLNYNGMRRIRKIFNSEYTTGYYQDKTIHVPNTSQLVGCSIRNTFMGQYWFYRSLGNNVCTLCVPGEGLFTWTFKGRRHGLIYSGCSWLAPKESEIENIIDYQTQRPDLKWYETSDGCSLFG